MYTVMHCNTHCITGSDHMILKLCTLKKFLPRVHVHVIPDQQHQTFKLVEQV